jgi:hypothetical protein
MAKTIPADEQVFMVSKSTNTTYSGSAALKAMSEWYTMADVTNTVRPYKVFTALLTQSGEGSFAFLTSGNVTKGITYQFDTGASEGGWDFSNVGGPTYPDTYSFIATQTATPNDYANAQLNYNTGAPVATVLENTIGNIWFTYHGVGFYDCNSGGLFTLNKEYIVINQSGDESAFDKRAIAYNFNDTNRIGIFTGYPTDGGTTSDDILQNYPIEIRVYN